MAKKQNKNKKFYRLEMTGLESGKAGCIQIDLRWKYHPSTKQVRYK